MQFATSTSVAIDIPAFVRSAAGSLATSLDAYWPADEFGKKDAEEKFLSVHFGHVFLQSGYAVFAEADHPDRNIRGIDVLAISEQRDHFIACEFKRHRSNSMGASFTDIERVASFRLNDRLRLGRLGQGPIRFMKSCELGIGLIAGLNWSSFSKGALADSDDQRRVSNRIDELHGFVGIPEHVYRYDADVVQGSYYLQFACFQSWHRTDSGAAQKR